MDLPLIEDRSRPEWVEEPTVIGDIARAAIAVMQNALEDVEVHPCDVHDEAVRAAGLTEPLKSLYGALKGAGVRFRF